MPPALRRTGCESVHQRSSSNSARVQGNESPISNGPRRLSVLGRVGRLSRRGSVPRRRLAAVHAQSGPHRRCGRRGAAAAAGPRGAGPARRRGDDLAGRGRRKGPTSSTRWARPTASTPAAGRIVWKASPDGAGAMGANTSSPCVARGPGLLRHHRRQLPHPRRPRRQGRQDAEHRHSDPQRPDLCQRLHLLPGARCRPAVRGPRRQGALADGTTTPGSRSRRKRPRPWSALRGAGLRGRHVRPAELRRRRRGRLGQEDCHQLRLGHRLPGGRGHGGETPLVQPGADRRERHGADVVVHLRRLDLRRGHGGRRRHGHDPAFAPRRPGLEDQRRHQE